jgi:hypothetical protein
MAAVRYLFRDGLPLADVEETFGLSVLAAKALFGEERFALDVDYRFDRAARACRVDAGTAVGRALNRIFLGLLRREFGAGFVVERASGSSPTA